MGTCSSVHKSNKPLVPSPRKQKAADGGGRQQQPVNMVATGLSLETSDLGSKREMFFDSRIWLDSDCEEDFFSVNGDFTPTRESTLNNQSSSLSTPSSKSFSAFTGNSSSEPSPTGRKKLTDLFQEASQPEYLSIEKVEANTKNSKLSQQTEADLHPMDRANSVNNRESSLSRDHPRNKEKEVDKAAVQCCLPSLIPNYNFSERRQKLRRLMQYVICLCSIYFCVPKMGVAYTLMKGFIKYFR
ncbi:uncharacterized protein M6B38_142570 [Iris pallida]|uniref:Uncharacterized protein n=1 Tax=Iris pallida TaxID=29817 RepID=A0AAX6FBD2_IRIPA|nr:uncharacterized protein M6B38_142570 [Iris pallida]